MRNTDHKTIKSFEVVAHSRRPYNLYCVGGDVKPCSINQSIVAHSSAPRLLRDGVRTVYGLVLLLYSVCQCLEVGIYRPVITRVGSFAKPLPDIRTYLHTRGTVYLLPTAACMANQRRITEHITVCGLRTWLPAPNFLAMAVSYRCVGRLYRLRR